MTSSSSWACVVIRPGTCVHSPERFLYTNEKESPQTVCYIALTWKWCLQCLPPSNTQVKLREKVLHPSSSIPFFHFFILLPVLWTSFSYSLILLSNTAIHFPFFPFTLFSLVCFALLPTVRDVLLVWGSVQRHILILEKLEAISKQDFVKGVFSFGKVSKLHNCIVL